MPVRADVTLPGLVEALSAAGVRIRQRDGETLTTDDALAQAIIDAYDPLPHVRAQKLAELAEYRWRVEEGGVRVGLVEMDSARDARTNLVGAVVGAQLALTMGRPFVTVWKDRTGREARVGPEQMITLGLAVHDHVAAAFAREAELRAQIEALTDWRAVDRVDVAAMWNAGGEGRG